MWLALSTLNNSHISVELSQKHEDNAYPWRAGWGRGIRADFARIRG
jgi:hypothetical protein